MPIPQVDVHEIETVSRDALTTHGAGTDQAAHVARAVARAEATGNVICGLYYLESYCLQLASGRVDGKVTPQVSQPRPGAVMADARYGFATLAVAHAHTCTSLGYFTEQIAARGLIGIGFTNASPVVAPPGGSRAVIGTNPIAMTVPGPDAPLMHFDFSTSAVALGKITMARAAGQAIPLGWAVDADGLPTTDPQAALDGALVSAGGDKGWGFGLMAEIMAAALTGSVNSLDVRGLKLPDGPPHDLGQFYILLDPATHGDHLASRFARIAKAVAQQEGTRIPGTDRRVMETVTVPDALWSLCLALATPAG